MECLISVACLAKTCDGQLSGMAFISVSPMSGGSRDSLFVVRIVFFYC